MIYSGHSYQMGHDGLAAYEDDAPPPVTAGEKAKAEREIRGMRRGLKKWVKYRQLAEGVNPSRDFALEQTIATQLHSLLSEVFDSSQLPSPDMSRNPEAGIELAKIAISGALPAEANSPEAQGLIWMWPLVIIVGAVTFTITSVIRSNAELAAEKERLACQRAGKCPDYGFWLKLGGIAIVSWIVWDTMGLRQRVTGLLSSKGGR